MRFLSTILGATIVFLGCVSTMRAQAQEKQEEPEPPSIKANFIGLDMATLARQVERVTQRSFLFDAAMLRNVTVTLQSESRVGPEEFYRVFQAICQMNGFAIVPMEVKGMRLEKIVQSKTALKEPGVHPVLIQGDAIPNTDALITYLAKLKHVTMKRLNPVLAPILTPSGSITQIPDTSLLLICDVASSIKRAEKMLVLLDVPGEKVATADVPIRNMEVARALTSLTQYVQAYNKANSGEATLGLLTVLPDERLNVLRLIGPEAEIKQALDYLARIDVDSPSAKRSIRYYKLKNVAVDDITEYVGQLLGMALTNTELVAVPGEATAPPAAGQRFRNICCFTKLSPIIRCFSAVDHPVEQIRIHIFFIFSFLLSISLV